MTKNGKSILLMEVGMGVTGDGDNGTFSLKAHCRVNESLPQRFSH